ncbi:DUF4127 family protein [Desulfotomaculum sp. 1211_IL3151]|uniref:DUF4127 family protein n=1 Tax=Desulfotomaculum sp. 1211_IL3151 TaxID=3084055 RepID=UPI002FDB5FCC
MKRIILLCFSLLLITSFSHSMAHGNPANEESPIGKVSGKVLFVPLDERPVSLDYVTQTIGGTGVEVITPPRELLPNKKNAANTDRLWQWVLEQCPQVDYLVMASDNMIYGGLIPSRIHSLDIQTLTNRVANFSKIKKINPKAKVYIFTTIMRSPRESGSTEEPDYYLTYGSKLFQYSALLDRADLGALTPAEEKRFAQLQADIPQAIRSDWFNRRARNLNVTKQLISLNKKGIIDYMALTRDDCAVHCASHHDFRRLQGAFTGMPQSQFITFPGADELGMVLLTRVTNELAGVKPKVYIQYAPGAGGNTLPGYEDQPLAVTVQDHIVAAGGITVAKPAEADLILGVNSPENGVTKEAATAHNVIQNRPGTVKFVETLQGFLQQNKKIAVADIAFSNGADNTFMALLEKEEMLPYLKAYSGWNTCSNSVGYTLGQGMLADYMDIELQQRLLTIRYLDDWAYQANIRQAVEREVLSPLGYGQNNLGPLEARVKDEIKTRLQTFADNHNLNVKVQDVSLPWHRAFNIKVEVEI